MLLRVVDPANELIAAKRRQRFPECKQSRICSNGSFKIVAGLMDGALRELFHVPFPVDADRALCSKPSDSERVCRPGTKCPRVLHAQLAGGAMQAV